MLGTLTAKSGGTTNDPVGDLSNDTGKPTSRSIMLRSRFILYS